MRLTNKFCVPQAAWYGDEEIELHFHPSWEVSFCPMQGADRPPLSEKQLEESFYAPIGTETIAQLAKGKKEVAIIFDDMSRPTKVFKVIPYLLEQLKAADIKDGQIRFIAALGAHGALEREDFVKKLGEEVLERFPVYNHNPFENCINIGKTQKGTPIEINSEVMSCDFKIGIGSILPHYTAGFGGGAKILIPGVASMETLWANHHKVGGRDKPTSEHQLGKLHPSVGIGKVEKNELRLDIEEGAKIAGLDVIINAVTNLQREIVGLYVGDFVAAHRRGLELARKVYHTNSVAEMDVVVVNAYAKASEAHIAVRLGCQSLKEEGGDIILINHNPTGQVSHYLSGHFGKAVGGRLWGPKPLAPRVRRLIIYTPYINRADAAWYGPEDSIIWMKHWEEVIDMVKKSYGNSARIAIYPDATVQYFGS